MISLSHEPKISGLLNNCGLHCLVPSIIKTLESLSNASDAEHNNFPHIDHYRRLLTTFQTYYELEHKPSFSELYNFLKSYHSLDQQLIMGSLLRTFVFEHTYMDPAVL